ncbi:DUF998 domain-containing protein [Maribacter sp. 2307ULW6-5]|uniref:DUF998 domain-containing protein n=1 Tax=Maribacter sp. 2307ULW6-5 TaxID=3386275 RepID=UPI0039BD0B25
MRQTISQLAQGPYAYIQDTGLVLLALGMLMAALGLYLNMKQGTYLRWGIFSLGTTALAIASLAIFNSHIGQPGTTVHRAFAAGIGLLFTASAMLLGHAAQQRHWSWARPSMVLGALFLLACPGVFLVPQACQGIYERGVALLLLVWCWLLGHALIKQKQ